MDERSGSTDGAECSTRQRRPDHEPRGTGDGDPPRRAHRLPVAVHAIGDLATARRLDAFEGDAPTSGRFVASVADRARECLGPMDLPRFAALGVAVSVHSRMRPPTAISPIGSGGQGGRHLRFPLAARVGRRRATARTRRSRSSSRSRGIRAGVLRTIDERPALASRADADVEQALETTCVTPAWLTGGERRRGKPPPRLPRRPSSCSRTDPTGRPRRLRGLATMAGGPLGAQSPSLGLMTRRGLLLFAAMCVTGDSVPPDPRLGREISPPCSCSRARGSPPLCCPGRGPFGASFGRSCRTGCRCSLRRDRDRLPWVLLGPPSSTSRARYRPLIAAVPLVGFLIALATGTSERFGLQSAAGLLLGSSALRRSSG